MNCISACQRPAKWLVFFYCSVLALSACHADTPAASKNYDLEFLVTPNPAEGSIDVSMQVRQSRWYLREVQFEINARFTDVAGSGELEQTDNEVVWVVPRGGGTLNWTVDVNNRRGDSFDAWLDVPWGIFRAEDIIPRATTRATVGSESVTTMRFKLPADWSVVAPFGQRRGIYQVRRDDRKFDQPTGWIAVGSLGTRIDKIDSTRVVIAGPTGQNIRRLDMLALLRWTLPELNRLLPRPMKRLTIISGNDPMWRGGLSAPTSLFIHAELPLISENGTSLILHEIMHVAMNLEVASGHDWIQEGLAEYYGLELLRRSGTISEARYRDSIDGAREWGESVTTLCDGPSRGPTTAAAVALLHDLDLELRSASGSIDKLLARLIGRKDSIDTRALIEDAETLLASTSGTLAADMLDRCKED